MNYLEENYLSVILVVQNDEKIVLEKLASMYEFLRGHFKDFEMIVVDNCSQDNTALVLNEAPFPLCSIRLARRHSIQQALTAGIEMAIGDYLLEIPDINVGYEEKYILDMYRTCLEGNDFVFCVPRNTSLLSKMFYKVLNNYFKENLPVELNTFALTLSSRRGQNKTADTGARVVNHSLAYALTGLQCALLYCDVNYSNRRGFFENVSLMIDTLIYYTDYIARISIGVALLFFALSLLGVIYGGFSYLIVSTVPGWMSAFVTNSAAFCAVFLILAIICKYLSHILFNSSGGKPYTFQSLQKKEKKDA